LSTETWKRLSWILGDYDLQNLIGKNDNQIGDYVGLLPVWIQTHLNNGYTFKLLVFKTLNCYQATWDNVFKLVEEYYPEVWPKVSVWIEKVKTTPWEEVEKMANFNFLEVSFKGRMDDNYIILKRLQEREGTFINVRSFLYFEIGLKELFKGDGFAYSETGIRGGAEYLTANCPVKELQHSYHDLHFNFST